MLYKTIFFYRSPLNFSCPVCLVLAGSNFISKFRVLILYFFRCLNLVTYGSNFIAGSNSIGTCVGFVWFCSVANFIVYQCMVSWTKGFQFCSYLQCNAFQGPNFIAPICFCMFFLHQSAQACAMRMLEKRKTWTNTCKKTWELNGFDGIWWLLTSCFYMLQEKTKNMATKCQVLGGPWGLQFYSP